MKDFTPTSYTLECVATGREFPDEGWTLDDAQCKCPSLIRTRYAKKQLELKSDEYGFYKFADWLPVRRMLENSKAPVTYKSKGLAAHLGLENLYITFNGYYPAIGAHMTTCSFKETEAYSVCARIDENEKRVLVVASAGNRQGLLRQPDSAALVGACRQPRCPVVRRTAGSLRETDLFGEGRRLFRCDPFEQPGTQER